jgi:hypothetical protein
MTIRGGRLRRLVGVDASYLLDVVATQVWAEDVDGGPEELRGAADLQAFLPLAMRLRARSWHPYTIPYRWTVADLPRRRSLDLSAHAVP